MPKRIPQQELDEIYSIVAAHPEGVPARSVLEKLAQPMPLRMLQRRLALLVEQGRLIAHGERKGRLYRPHVTVTAAGALQADNATMNAQGEVYVPISPQSEELKKLVRMPFQGRQPVGYHRSFLVDYTPNADHYLPAETRQHLHRIGRVDNDQRAAGTYVRTIFNRLLIDLSWNSSRLEGNTYSLLETERLLELGEVAVGKDAFEAQMILNHKAAIEMLVDQADDIGFNRYTILNLHALLADNLLLDPQAGGRLRRIPVSIEGTVYHPLEVPQLINDCFELILGKATAITDPFEQSFFALVHFAYLQGFEDVNKRVSRLAANIPLVRDNFCPLSFVDVPERAYVDGLLAVYELNQIELLRDVFVWAYERSSARYSAVRQSIGQPDPFRMRYMALIRELVSTVVKGEMDKQTAIALTRQRVAEQVSTEDQARFTEIVETELMSLHESNIARYRLRPSQFHAWQRAWR